MCKRLILSFVVVLAAGCMCWPPIPNASVHSRRSRAKRPPPPIEPVDYVTPANCELDLVDAWVDCDAVYQVDSRAGTARVGVDVPRGYELRMELEICDPVGWVLNVGDSPTNDGGGGDYGSTSSDAEFQIRDTTLDVFGNDYSLGSEGRRQTVTAFLPACGCELIAVRVRDGEVVVRSSEREHVFRGDTLLRLGPAHDAEGTPDHRWFVGLNRVVDRMQRHGSGVMWARLTVGPAASRARR